MKEKTMEHVDLTIPKGAVFSADRKHRYALWRVWSSTRPLPLLMMIGLNPSKAGEVRDDPTVTRMIARAGAAGYGGLLVGNLYGFVSTDPGDLIRGGNSVGTETDDYLREMISLSGRQICGWGSFPAVKARVDSVMQMIPDPYCLGVNKDGEPKHPLYVSYETPFMKYMRRYSSDLPQL
jgi:hypothetical protein